jgi:hypothetical protein
MPIRTATTTSCSAQIDRAQIWAGTKAWLSGFTRLRLESPQPGLGRGRDRVPAWHGGWCHLFWQVATLDIDDPDNCLQRFRSNRDFGLIVFAAIVLGLVLASRFWSGMNRAPGCTPWGPMTPCC